MRLTGLITMAAALTSMVLTTACSNYRESQGQSDSSSRSSDVRAAPTDDFMARDARGTVEWFKRADPSISRFFDTAAGYAVFPKVTQGGAGIGALHGNGVLFDHGRLVGDAEVSAGSIGAQLGGQTYSEIIFFQTPLQLERFKRGEVKFSAAASAVAASSGAAAKSDYAEGVAVFVGNQSGLMAEASIGGQGFKYRPR